MEAFVAKLDPSDSAFAFHPDTDKRFRRQWVVDVRTADGDLEAHTVGSLPFCEAEAAKLPDATVTELQPPGGDGWTQDSDGCWRRQAS